MVNLRFTSYIPSCSRLVFNFDYCEWKVNCSSFQGALYLVGTDANFIVTIPCFVTEEGGESSRNICVLSRPRGRCGARAGRLFSSKLIRNAIWNGFFAYYLEGGSRGKLNLFICDSRPRGPRRARAGRVLLALGGPPIARGRRFDHAGGRCGYERRSTGGTVGVR